jgi:hypothetical protein
MFVQTGTAASPEDDWLTTELVAELIDRGRDQLNLACEHEAR